MIAEVEKTSKSSIILERTSTHKYNAKLSTRRVNHETTFKNAPKMSQMDKTRKKNTHIGTDYFSCMDLKEETITVKLMSKPINCKTTG